MALYTQDSKQRLREAIDMVDLVNSHTDLRRAGVSNYVGLCPFHEERTPSFSVDPLQKVYYCFGCQAAGDVFAFVMELEGLDFPATLEMLADRYGVQLELEREDPAARNRRQQRERLYALLERVTTFYERSLWDSKEATTAREYLAGRGIESQVLRDFRVGYAPSAGNKVVQAAKAAGYTQNELFATGLAATSRTGGRVNDRFRERIIFPLADLRGRIIGFGARAIRSDLLPKYLNTSEGELYHKGRQLFGVDRARSPAAKTGTVILAEGYLDVLALHQSGFMNSVGSMGTALTPNQIGELARLAPVLLLALDADNAGKEGMLRAAKVAEKRKLELRVIPLEAGNDPADLLQKSGKAAIEKLINNSQALIQFQVERILETESLDSVEGRDRALVRLKPVLGSESPSAMREELLRIVAGKLEISEQLVNTLVQQTGETEFSSNETRSNHVEIRPLTKRALTERTFLALCIALPAQGQKALAAMDRSEHFTEDLTRKAANYLCEHLNDPIGGLTDETSDIKSLIAELTVRSKQVTATPAGLEVEALQLRKARLDRKLAAARINDNQAIDCLATQRLDLQSKIDRALERALAS